ncbi:sensor histidine kinase [Indibacter alkaliphilus LW1]|uniref:histidine kinase n=1 Tax=Indibacter alkaliphilus (strain CCUG 57479 / KCTC 22604 / LW1) TaxID=1189612 RepID=S2EA62_INDAL|nr:HAMP domain-containing sensor histidine kinase [Indibacter alkaliphilus]EOZ99228.1 sensor histidine kinase [Indibacter alkaliphilus LW1]
MRLLNILTTVYLLITLTAVITGGYFIYRKLVSEIDFELGMELERQIEAYAQRISNGLSPSALENDRLQITELPYDLEEEALVLSDTIAYHDPMNREEKQLKASKSYKIGDKHYRISYYNLVVEAEDITETVVYTMVLVFLIQIIFVVFFFRSISNRVLRPFQNTLKKIKQFDFGANEPLVFEETKISEFDQLNGFLEKMTQKLLIDYRQIKEFSENISHEIQTPTAVVGGKLENLLNSEITEDQAVLIYAAYQNNEKIHRIVKSLGLLAKLQNAEFDTSSKIDLSEILEKSIELISELVILSELKFNADIRPEVFVNMHPSVAEIMFSNLLSNAVKHNFKGGWIKVSLSPHQLLVSNSGKSLTKKTDELKGRFKKESSNSDSVGLGLAIVNQICKTYHFQFDYSVSKDDIHTITIDF